MKKKTIPPMKQTTEIDEAEAKRRGQMIAEAFHFKRDKNYSDRWRCTWGNKTSLGVYYTLKRMIEDGK